MSYQKSGQQNVQDCQIWYGVDTLVVVSSAALLIQFLLYNWTLIKHLQGNPLEAKWMELLDLPPLKKKSFKETISKGRCPDGTPRLQMLWRVYRQNYVYLLEIRRLIS